MDIDLLEDNTSANINDALAQAINKAWTDVEGLMGGDNPHIHIKEIASRLCQILPNNPDGQNEIPMDINLPDVDDLVKETTYKPTKITSLWQHLGSNSVKQEEEGTHINDIDLTKAYLRLAAQT